MFNPSKALIIAAVAMLSATAVSAQEAETVSFRYDRALSVEANYDAFKLTAKRACDVISTLGGPKAQKECRESLVAQAVTATQVSGFIAFHQNSTDGVQMASVNR